MKSSLCKSVTVLHQLIFKPTLGFGGHTVSHRSYSMTTKDIVNRLVSIAPLNLAERWDNVGLLVEPTSPHVVKKLLLTNDLTQPVLDEAVGSNIDMILSYHPPIFRPLKKLCQNSVKEKLIVQCIEHRIAVFSPHTSYDAAANGVNDWLISAFG